MSGNGLPPGLVTSDEETGRVKASFPPEIFDANKAITTQPFTEVNSKLGTQYETSVYVPILAPNNGTTELAIVTGNNPVVVKSIDLQFNSTVISAQLFRGGTYTGGSSVPVYNLNDENAVVGEAAVFGGITVTDIGVPVGPEIYSLGNEGVGNVSLSAVSQQSGVERILWSNSTYIYRIINRDTVVPSRISGIASWYEGPVSVDIDLVE